MQARWIRPLPRDSRASPDAAGSLTWFKFRFLKPPLSTFSLWRKKLSSSVKENKPLLAVTADAAFIASNLDGELAPHVPAVAPPAADAPASRDRVTLSLAGVRIELSGVHAERIVRFVLGQLGGGRC